jgi:hypothetical protein
LQLSWRSHLAGKDGCGEGDGDGCEDGREDAAESIPITRVPGRFGGSYALFLCPGRGASCGRPVAKLYFLRGYFLCRHCHQLSYAAQFEKPWQRAFRRVRKLRQRLAETPVGRQAGTYERLLERVLQAELQADAAGTDQLLWLAGHRKPPKLLFTLD